jgi:transmembrane sensor
LSRNLFHISYDLLVKYLLDEATEKEIRQVEDWIKNDPANKKHFDQLKTIWQESKTPVHTNVDEGAAWQRFKNRVAIPQKNKLLSATIKPMRWLRVAAIFVLIAGGAYFGYRLLSIKPVKELLVASNGSVLTDTLPDGSIVTLNKNSSLSYPSQFQKGTRQVTLSGEAFFNVTPDKKHPFVIQVNDVSILVVGTSFNVKTVGGKTEVVVESGVVKVSRKNKSVDVFPEEAVTISQEDSVLVKVKQQDQLYNYYRSKEFVCASTPLWKLVAVLNEAYGFEHRYRKQKTAQLPAHNNIQQSVAGHHT